MSVRKVIHVKISLPPQGGSGLKYMLYHITNEGLRVSLRKEGVD